jgi:hypothetical protein
MAKNTLLLSGKCGAHRVSGGQGLDGTLEGNERRHALADTHSASLLHRAELMRCADRVVLNRVSVSARPQGRLFSSYTAR